MSATDSSAIVAAVQAGDIERLRGLLASHAAAASAHDANGVSAIMHALYMRREEIVALLLAAAPELDIFEAVSTGRAERVEELLRRDPSPVSRWSGDGFTALHLACFFRQEQVAALLLQQGADAAAVARNPMQVTPLHSAVAARSLPIARLLLEHGAPPSARQQQGWTALHSAAQHGDRTLVELLLAHGADRSAASDDGTTPAALAGKNGHSEIVVLLSGK